MIYHFDTNLFVQGLAVVAKKMVKKKNQVEKMVKKRRNNCQMNICVFFKQIINILLKYIIITE
jgi:hypothetical protein